MCACPLLPDTVEIEKPLNVRWALSRRQALVTELLELGAPHSMVHSSLAWPRLKLASSLKRVHFSTPVGQTIAHLEDISSPLKLLLFNANCLEEFLSMIFSSLAEHLARYWIHSFEGLVEKSLNVEFSCGDQPTQVIIDG